MMDCGRYRVSALLLVRRLDRKAPMTSLSNGLRRRPAPAGSRSGGAVVTLPWSSGVRAAKLEGTEFGLCPVQGDAVLLAGCTLERPR